MPTAPDVLYDRLQDPAEVAALFGTAEDTILDCKQWLGDEKSKRSMLAKAVSGFANGDGGVIAIGLIANSHGKDDPDVIKEPAYVPAPHEVKAKVLSYLQSDVEPLIHGLRVDVVPMEQSGAGVVLVLVPSQDGLPMRSKRDWQFYLRSGSSTQNMPLTVLADRFGRRPHAKLVATIDDLGVSEIPTFGSTVWMGRAVKIFVQNVGTGVARFPALFVHRECPFTPSRDVVGQVHSAWTYSEVGEAWRSFRGGSEAVVYPGESVLVGEVVQRASTITDSWVKAGELRVQLVCDGIAPEETTFALEARSA